MKPLCERVLAASMLASLEGAEAIGNVGYQNFWVRPLMPISLIGPLWNRIVAGTAGTRLVRVTNSIWSLAGLTLCSLIVLSLG
ncbi:hypothetical protein D9M72_615160 [compost metagenome]